MNKPGVYKPRFDRFDGLLLIVLLSSFALLALSSLRPLKFGDQVFHDDARKLAAAVRGDASWRDVTFTLAPGPVVFYAIPYIAVPPGSPDSAYWRAGFVFMIACMGAALLLLRRAGSLAGGTATGRIVSVIAMLLPFGVYYSYGISAEPPGYIGACVLAYGWARNYRLSQAPKTIAILCAGLCMVILARLGAIVILPLVLLAAVALWRSRNAEGRRQGLTLGAAVAIAAMALAGVFASMAFMERRHLVYTQTDNFYQTAFQGCFQFRKEPLDWRHWTRETRKGSVDYADWASVRETLIQRALSTGESYWSLRRKWVIHDFTEHPVVHFRQAAIRVLALEAWRINSMPAASFRFAGISGPALFYGFHVLVNGANCIVLALALAFFWFNRNRLAMIWGLWAPGLGLLLFHAATYSDPRYMFSSLPSLYLAAALALSPAAVQFGSDDRGQPSPLKTAELVRQ